MKFRILLIAMFFSLPGCSLYKAWVEAQLKDCLQAPPPEKETPDLEKQEETSEDLIIHLPDSDPKVPLA